MKRIASANQNVTVVLFPFFLFPVIFEKAAVFGGFLFAQMGD